MSGEANGRVHESIIEEHHPSPDRIVAIADYSLNWAAENLLRKETDQVVLLNVRPYNTPPVLLEAPFVDLSMEYTKIDQAAKTASHDLIKKVLLDKGIRVRGVALRGDPKEEIVYKVEDVKADVLVIGSRGMGALKRTFIGSTSDYCIHHCHCTVIVPRK